MYCSICPYIIEIHMEDNVLYIERLNHLDYIEAANDMGLQIAIGDVIDSRNHFKDLSLCKVCIIY